MDRSVEGETLVTMQEQATSATGQAVMLGDLPPAQLPPAQAAPVESPATDLRATLLGQFEQWLDEMLANEPPPRGLPAELVAGSDAGGNGTSVTPVESDLYSVYSSLTALSGEIGLQGRAFKQLTATLAPLAETPAMLDRLEEAQRKSAETLAQAIEDAGDSGLEIAASGKQICEVLIDLNDRLERGLRTCDNGIESMRASGRHGWMWRMTGGPAVIAQAMTGVQALRDSCAMTLGRLQSAMQDWGIQKIGATGDLFDPRQMTVVDVRTTDEAPAGSVVEVIRSGYALNGQVEAVARVAVAKPHQSSHQSSIEE
jgi:hypothetical protein